MSKQERVDSKLSELKGLAIPAPEIIATLQIEAEAIGDLNRNILKGLALVQDCRVILGSEDSAAVNQADIVLQTQLAACQKLIDDKGHKASQAKSREVAMVGILLKEGHYPAAKDLEHNDAETALKAFLGVPRAVPGPDKKTVIYMGAFHLPHQKTEKEIPAFKAALEAAKAKMAADYARPDKITPPVTLRFLVNDPSKGVGGTGHNTVLEVTFQTNGKILLQNLDSLKTQPTAPVVELEETAWGQTVKGVVTGVFADAPLEHDFVERVCNPLGKQNGVECIYFSTAEIAKHYVADPESFEDPDTRKKAVVAQMLRASGHPEMKPEMVTLATEETVKKYKDIVPALAKGDVIYPPVLESNYLIRELNKVAVANDAAVRGNPYGVEPLEKDAAFIQNCRALIALHAPANPPLADCEDSVRRILIPMLVIQRQAQALKEALCRDVPADSEERKSAIKAIHEAITPHGLDNGVGHSLDKKNEELPQFMTVLNAAIAECDRLLTAAGAAAKKKKEEQAPAVAEEKADVFKGMTREKKKALLLGIAEDMKSASPMALREDTGYVSIAFKVAEKDDPSAAGKKTADIEVTDTECKMRVMVTLTKKDGSTEAVPATLTRTVDPGKPGELLRVCDGNLSWEAKCQLMAEASFRERKKAAADKGVAMDLRICVELNEKPRVPVKGLIIAGKQCDDFTKKEADMINAYSTRFAEVHSQGRIFCKDGKAQQRELRESLFPGVLGAKKAGAVDAAGHAADKGFAPDYKI